MKTYFTIVSISTKPFLGEKIGIGLLCLSPSGNFFHFSSEKFKLISKLLPIEAKSLALNSLKEIESTVLSVVDGESQLVGATKFSNVTESYINYLHRYNTNLIQFSKVETIDLELNELVFQKMVQKYIYSNEIFEPIQKTKITSVVEQFKSGFKSQIKKYVNIDFKVSNDIIKGLISPVTVDLFGKNGAFVTGQTIDFSKDKIWLSHDINAYMYLALTTEMNDERAKCFLLGEEPSKKLILNHEMWDNARNAKNIEFVSLNESQKVIDYLVENQVSPIV
jgi:hypothetical protein